MTIRRTPQDFVVTETLARATLEAMRPAWSREAPFAVFSLSKTSLTTPEATQRLAKTLGVKASAVEHAGLKDKHAETTQHVSVRLDARSARQPTIEGPGLRAAIVGFLGRHVSARDIDHNRFQIVVRDLTRERAVEMDRRTSLLAANDGLRIVNYFGDQRFGSARAGEGFIARHLVRGEFEQALRLAIATPARKDAKRVKDTARTIAANWGQWAAILESLPRTPNRRALETLTAGGTFRDAFADLPYFFQQMTVEAYQSLLWNATARSLAERTPTPLITPDPFGVLVFPRAEAIPDAWLTLDVPTLAPGTSLDAPTAVPWADAARSVLALEGLTLDQLVIPGLRRPAFGEAPRPLIATASEFSSTPAEPDELAPGRLKRMLTFTLPRGAYATVVLRALGE